MEVIKDISWIMSSNDLEEVEHLLEVVLALSGVAKTSSGLNSSVPLMINA